MVEVLIEDRMFIEEFLNEDDKLSYVVKIIFWESEKLRKRKKVLDKIYGKI